MTKFTLEKSIWTQNDIENMGWHDCQIHGMSISKEIDKEMNDLVFDIDYIFKWYKPAFLKKNFTFEIAPCTLVFHNASDLIIDVSTSISLAIEIDNIEFKQGHSESAYEITINTQQGIIKFEAEGFTQFVRQPLIHNDSMSLSFKQRGRTSFERKGIESL